MLLVAIDYTIRMSLYSNQKMEVVIGEKYLRNYFWDNDDPFFKPNIDTVEVLDIKNGYVLYYVNGFETSTSIKSFKQNCREIKKADN